MELCYRGVNYKPESVVFHQHKSSFLIKGKYRGYESSISPGLTLTHQTHLQLKYRGVKYTKGSANCDRETFFKPQLQPVAI